MPTDVKRSVRSAPQNGSARSGVSGATEGESFTTLELQIYFVRPVGKGRLTAEARVVERGRRVGLVECDVFSAEGKRVARASCTQMTLRGEEASGR